MNISGSIVIYNEDKEILKQAIESFLSLKCKKELVVIDNSPTDTLRSFCREFDLKYIYNLKNIGFGAAHNLAFKNLSLKSDLHFIINPDIYFDPKNIDDFSLWFFKQEDISLAVPNVLNIDETVQPIVRNIPTPLSLLKRKLNIDTDEIQIKSNMVQEIPFAHGCFMCFKTDVYKKLNGFDERFFLYMEDVDIFLRAKEFGKTVMNSNFFVYHRFAKGSSKKVKLFLLHLISAVKFFLKYRSGKIST